MGRYDFRPHRVHETATRLLQAERITQAPPWLRTVGNVPPAQILVRTQPIQHYEHGQASKARKPSKMFQPQRITYEEDALRRQFFSDHPWELARPRLVLENDGRDAERQDWSEIQEEWSKIGQSARSLDGESVVQRQMWLMHNVPGMTVSKAYDKARKEFYELRLQEEVEQRVAKEEAQATGAHFGKSMLQIGMELEDQTYEKWKQWATRNAALITLRDAAMYTGTGNDEPVAELGDVETEARLDELTAETVPAKG